MVLAPKVRFGTKWPSMTSRWIRSAPAFCDPADRVREVREVGVEDARRDPCPPGAPSLLPRPGRARARGCVRRAARRRSRRRAARAAGRPPAPAARPPVPRPAGRTPRRSPGRGCGGSSSRCRPPAGSPRTRSMTGIGLAVQGVWATGFIGMRLTWAWSPRSRSAIASASSVRVVHAADHRHLVADPPAGRRGVIAGRVDDLGDRPAPVQRHEHVAQRIARRVQRDRQRELRAERGQRGGCRARRRRSRP